MDSNRARIPEEFYSEFMNRAGLTNVEISEATPTSFSESNAPLGVSLKTGGPDPMTPRKIMVVDDEHLIADTLSLILRSKGWEPTTAYNGAAGLQRFQETRPEYVITDVVMPEMNGVEMAIRIRELDPDCRILLFSGQAATTDLVENARSRGHEFEVLAKPVHPAELLAKLEAISKVGLGKTA